MTRNISEEIRVKVNIRQRLQHECDFQFFLVLSVDSLHLLFEVRDCRFRPRDFVVKFYVCVKVEVIPNFLLQIIVCAREITHGLHKIKLKMRIVRNVGNNACHSKIIFVILADRLFDDIGRAKVFYCCFFDDNDTLGI